MSNERRVEVTEENIRPWAGTVTSVKQSPLSGTWLEVRRDDDGRTYGVPESLVRELGAMCTIPFCKSRAFPADSEGRCFTHFERERKDRRNLPPTLAPASLFDERAETYPRTVHADVSVIAKDTFYTSSPTNPWICDHPDMPTFGGSAFECEGCCAQMDEDHG